jgi:transglutaminase-like putative cysteine protease
LTVDPAGSAFDPPTDDDRAPTRWLQSDDDEIRALATSSVLGIDGERERMLALEATVRRHISTKSLRIGYASALETLRLREGDCTEHAVLLAALARAAGIPARVATGLTYTTVFGNRRHVFVPHAWVFAWVDGRWQGFDAAQPGYDSGHIAFSSDHGDPFRFYRGLELLGRLQIDAIERGRGRR